jgi:hypothetical protein
MQPDEEPEQQLSSVSDAQLAAYLAGKKTAADKAAGVSSLGGFASGTAAKAAPPSAAGGKGSPSSKGGSRTQPGNVEQQQQAAGPPAAVLNEVQVLKLQLEQQQLTAAMSGLAGVFDASLASLRSAQLELAVGLKGAEGRLLMILQELGLLKVCCVWGSMAQRL